MAIEILDAEGKPVRITATPNLELVVDDIPMDLVDRCVGVQSVVLGSADQVAYDERMGIHAKHYLTMVGTADARWILDKIADCIAGKTVVEIGAGVGVLAIALAGKAKHVYAIEADPCWSFVFARYLYRGKPTNLTYILDRAENLVDVIKADVAIVVTGSDADNLRELAGKFAPEVILPWQDYRDGRAVVTCWGHLGGQGEESR